MNGGLKVIDGYVDQVENSDPMLYIKGIAGHTFDSMFIYTFHELIDLLCCMKPGKEIGFEEHKDRVVKTFVVPLELNKQVEDELHQFKVQLVELYQQAAEDKWFAQ